MEAGYAAGEFVRYFGMSARPRPSRRSRGLLLDIGAGSIVARHLPDGLRGAHVPMADGGYIIHHLPDDWRGGVEQTLLHETYEIIFESRGEGYGDARAFARVCREAGRFAAAVLMQQEPFEAFAMATGLDVIALKEQFQCSYKSVAMRLGEVLSDLPLLAVLYERREQGDPSSWLPGPRGERFQGLGGGADARVWYPELTDALRREGWHAPVGQRAVHRFDGRPGGDGGAGLVTRRSSPAAAMATSRWPRGLSSGTGA